MSHSIGNVFPFVAFPSILWSIMSCNSHLCIKMCLSVCLSQRDTLVSCFVLSVAVQMIARKDSSPKLPTMRRVGHKSKTLLTQSVCVCSYICVDC